MCQSGEMESFSIDDSIDLKLYTDPNISWEGEIEVLKDHCLASLLSASDKMLAGVDSCILLTSARYFLDYQCPAELEHSR